MIIVVWLKVARGYFLGTEVLFSKSSFGHVNLNRFFLIFGNRNDKCSNFIKLLISIGNHMISANKIARARRASAICSL